MRKRFGFRWPTAEECLSIFGLSAAVFLFVISLLLLPSCVEQYIGGAEKHPTNSTSRG